MAPSDREMFLRHLAEAKRAVSRGNAHIARQREIVAELERDGHNTTKARDLLATFETVQASHEEYLARLRAEIAEGD
jgi:hypothetical protein